MGTKNLKIINHCPALVSDPRSDPSRSQSFSASVTAVQHVATEVKTQIEDFRPYIPLIQGLRNPGMRSRHWELLSDELGFQIKPKQTLTFEKCLELGLQNHIDKISKVAEVAGKEYSIEQVHHK